MKVLSVVSAKGGVGKSTISANIAVALQYQGHPVLAIDLDPQNGLRYHFSLAERGGRGLAQAFTSQALSDAIRTTESGVGLLPYGEVSEEERRQFELTLAQNPNWLFDNLDALGLDPDAIVVLDTPPGPSVYMDQALRTASLVLAVVLPDAGSYATLPQIHRLIDRSGVRRSDFIDYGFVVNQVDRTRQLSRDVLEVLRASLGNKVVGHVHLDQAVGEALACGKSVLEYSPYSEGARDIAACAQWVEHSLLTARSEP